MPLNNNLKKKKREIQQLQALHESLNVKDQKLTHTTVFVLCLADTSSSTFIGKVTH